MHFHTSDVIFMLTEMLQISKTEMLEEFDKLVH